MPRWQFKPDPLATVLVVAGAVLLTSLGVWQLSRRTEMAASDTALRARLDLPPLTSVDIARDGYMGIDVRRVQLDGRFNLAAPQLIRGQYWNGEIGYHVVFPFRPTGEAEQILVNRGWIPREKATDTLTQLHADPVTSVVEGLIRIAGPADPSSRATPSEFDPPGASLWSRMDAGAMAMSITGATTTAYIVAGVRLDGDGAATAGAHPPHLPIGGYSTMPVRRPHLEYALTWFSLALILIGGYISRFLRKVMD